MKLLRYLPIVFILSSFIACKKNNDTTGTGNQTDPALAQTFLNVSYGTDAAQKMDVYLPANRSTANTKVIVLIHGGAWSSGDKADFSTLTTGMLITDTLKTRFPGYAIFNLNYRLSTGTANLFPTQENDIRAAVQFIYDKSGDYFIGNKYVFMGVSAGAHLAMLQGYKYSMPVRPKAIVSFFGPADLTDMYYYPAGPNPVLSQLILGQTIGTTPIANAGVYIASSPLNYINTSSVPTILLHGENDPLVKPSQSAAVHAKLTHPAVGIASQYVLYPGKGHGDDWGDATYKDAFTKIQAFVTANVQ